MSRVEDIEGFIEELQKRIEELEEENSKLSRDLESAVEFIENIGSDAMRFIKYDLRGKK